MNDEGYCKECGHPGGGHNLGCRIHHQIALEHVDKLTAALTTVRTMVEADPAAKAVFTQGGYTRNLLQVIDAAIGCEQKADEK